MHGKVDICMCVDIHTAHGDMSVTSPANHPHQYHNCCSLHHGAGCVVSIGLHVLHTQCSSGIMIYKEHQ